MFKENFRLDKGEENDLLPWFIYRYLRNNVKLLKDEYIFNLYEELNKLHIEKYTKILGSVDKAKVEIEYLLQFESEHHILVNKEIIFKYIEKTK